MKKIFKLTKGAKFKMTKKELFKNIIVQNSPNKNDILANVLAQPVNIKNPFNIKRIIKYTLPAIMVLMVIFVQLFAVPVLKNQQQIPANTGNNAVVQVPKNNNWFSIVAYAADDTLNTIIQSEMTNGIKIKLPSLWIKEESGLKIVYAYYDTAGFKIEGENIKSVHFESKNGMVRTLPLIIPSPTPNWKLANEPEITPYLQIPKSATLDGNDILNLMFLWTPDEYQTAFSLGENYQEFLTDTITITVMFDDGEEITQIIAITIDDESGDIYAELKNE